MLKTKKGDNEQMTTIVLVEDHAVMAQTMAQYLRQKLDAEVHIIQSAEAALRELPEMQADLILIDVSLPKMSGIELIERLHERLPDLPCLAVSGHTEPKYVRRAFRAGVQGYVHKGDPDALADAVESVLAGDMYLSEEVPDL